MMRNKIVTVLALVAVGSLLACMGPKPVQLGDDAYRAGDAMTAQQQYQAGIDGGDPEAVLAMALLYAEGQGVPQDGKRAVELMKAALAQGSNRAATCLGVCSYYGLDMPQDYKVAAGYFALAAMDGDYLAIEYLAYMLENGIGVEKNPERALAIQDLAPLP